MREELVLDIVDSIARTRKYSKPPLKPTHRCSDRPHMYGLSDLHDIVLCNVHEYHKKHTLMSKAG